MRSPDPRWERAIVTADAVHWRLPVGCWAFVTVDPKGTSWNADRDAPQTRNFVSVTTDEAKIIAEDVLAAIGRRR